MSVFDKIKDAFGGDKDKQKAKEAAQQTADQVKEAAEKIHADQATKARDEAEAREAADREATAKAEAERQAQVDAEAAAQAEAAAAELRVQEDTRAAEDAVAAKPSVSVSRVREVVAHDSSPNTQTGEGMDKELGLLLETALRRALDQAGLPNRNTDDGSLGTLFLESYSRWQGHLGYSGSDADGVPGRESLAKLAEATGMFDLID
ncbi:MAG TPA: hypothetical protein GXZ30_15055 [Propionibacterium sp.]|jgi:hypothetical protein|nr:hypothetical protein [Propionibacterium sp.]